VPCDKGRRREVDWRLKRFAQRLCSGKLDGVALHDGKLCVAPVRAATPPEAEALAERIDRMMPRARCRVALKYKNVCIMISSIYPNVQFENEHLI
jgi:hypothetical protein